MQSTAQKPRTLITGAGRRIGAMLAEHLAAAGHDLVLHYHQSGMEAQTLAKQLRAQYGADVALVQADLAAPEMLANFWRDLPPCTALIHNASQFTRDTLADFTPEALRAHLAVHLESPLMLTQGFMAQLPTDHSQASIIVLTDGTMGWSVAPQFFSYAISKQAWHSAIDILAAAVAPHARANVIALGPTLMGATDNETTFAHLAERAPLKRTNAPIEVAQAIDYLLIAPGVTGQVLSLANGFGLNSARPV